MPIVVEKFKPALKNTLRGFARIRFPSGLAMAGIGLHVDHGCAPTSPPSRPRVDTRTGTTLRHHDGKLRWQPMITLSNNIHDAWLGQIVAAVHEAYPDALQGLVREGAL